MEIDDDRKLSLGWNEDLNATFTVNGVVFTEILTNSVLVTAPMEC